MILRRPSPISEDHINESLDEALEETFPASDPIAPAVPVLDEVVPEQAA